MTSLYSFKFETLSENYSCILNGFVLQLMASLTVATSLFIKNKNATSFSSSFKPVLQIIFLLINAGILVFTFIDKTKESLMGIGILLLGLVVYYFDKPVVKEKV